MSAIEKMKAEPGHLYGVGVGPGDAGLITLRAAALIGSADVIAYHQGSASRPSIARGIAADLIGNAIEEPLVYPVTTGESRRGYYADMAEFYDECAARLKAHLQAGRSVVVLAEGDPLFFGSFMYVHDLLSPRFPSTVVPGVTSMSAASAAVATGLCRHEDTLTVLPGTLGVPELARRLADTQAAVIMKLGRTFSDVREAAQQAGVLDRAWYVERASSPQQRVLPLADVDPQSVPYMSIVVITGEDLRADSAGRADSQARGDAATDAPVPQRDTATNAPAPQRDIAVDAPTAPVAIPNGAATVYVVGLGPGPDRWLTPEASDVLKTVQHVIGYAPYVARVPQREGLRRHVSGNTVEVDRGRLALELALSGESVAVVSGGDAGVFGMASAVFEAADTDERLAGIDIQVIPGMTAAHAAAALAGAVLGADHALISLSDRLKPWEVVVRRIQACAAADIAMAFYNPRSRSRPDQLGLAKAALLEVAPPDRIVLLARNVGRDGESLTVTTLGELDPEQVDMSTLVIIGASSTRLTRDGRAWTPRFVTG
ncbi:MAG: precorrin-3B C(17)-methyltransferase [Cumulibacter sp.]